MCAVTIIWLSLTALLAVYAVWDGLAGLIECKFKPEWEEENDE